MPDYVVNQSQPTTGSRLPDKGFWVAHGLGDYPPSNLYANKSISGHVRLSNGNPVGGATVYLIRQVDAKHVATTTSSPQGTYSFVRGPEDPHEYFVVAFSLVNGAVQIHGASNRGLVGI